METRTTAYQLAFGVECQRTVVLSEPTGKAERAAGGDAQQMLGALLTGVDVEQLTRGDRDRALAHLYGNFYTWDVLADTRCMSCDARFELRFSLRDMLAARQPDGTATGTPPQIAVEASRLRLPCVKDRAETPEEFLKLLTLDGPAPALETAEAALEQADPALEFDLPGTCPDCGETQSVPFSMSKFLSAALTRDYQFLMREVHILARTYRWSLDSILALTRAERQEFVRLVLADQGNASAVVRRIS
ncbi:MAG: hypothetical protein ABJ360_25510 [Roseobacter sp.]